MDRPAGLGGEQIAPLIGAEPETVLCADSTSLNVFKVLAVALRLRPERRVILSDTGNFPTDLYMAQGLGKLSDKQLELRLVTPEQVEEALNEDVAVLMLTEVDYRTGRKHNMEALTRKAHGVGALTLWDLAHSAGAFPVNLAGTKADFAVGCGYKYLNGGPGAPGFLYVSPQHRADVANPLTGWMGHAAPFAFELGYEPAKGVAQMRVGTPQILGMAALKAALTVFEGVTMQQVQQKSIALSELFRQEVQARCPDLRLASPIDPYARGSQLSFCHPHGYAIMQALIDRGVLGDFRAPDIIRFGFAPLYLSFAEVYKAAEILEDVMKYNIWDRAQYRQKSKVT